MALAAALLLVVFLTGSATGVQRTVLSIYAKGFVKSALLAFMPLVIYGLFKGTIDMIGGWLSDRRGRRFAIILGTAVYLLGAFSIVGLRSLSGIILGNVMVGLGEGIVFASAMIALSDIAGSKEAGLGFGFMEAFVYSGFGAGATIAGFLWQAYGIQAPFYYSLAASATALLLAITAVRETKGLVKFEERARAEENIASTLEAYKICIRTPSVLVTFFAAHVAKFTDALAWAAFPLLFAAKGYGDVQIGLLQGVITFSWALTMPIFGRLSDKWGRKPIIVSGLFLKGLGILALLEAPGFMESLAASLLVGVSYSMYYPILPAVAVDIAPLSVKGRVLGLYRGIRDLGYFTGGLLIGALIDAYGLPGAFNFTVTLIFAAGVLAIFLLKETRPIWPFFRLVLSHVDTMQRTAVAYWELVDAYRRGDVGEAEELLREVKELEHLGDKLKVEILDKIWASRLPFGDRMDFERIVETLDVIAGRLYQAGEKLLRRSRGEVPDEFLDELLCLIEKLRTGLEVFRRDVEALHESPAYALKLAEEVRELEREMDSATEKALTLIEDGLDAGKIDVVTYIFLKEVVDKVEDAADYLKDASDIVRVVSLKHST